MAELNWNSMNVGGSGEGTPFMKILPGENRIRVVGLPFQTQIHWEETNSGSKKRITCLEQNCPICKVGKVPQKKFQVLVIDRADKAVKILEGGPAIFGSIRQYASDADYGDPSKYDIKIRKEGSGRETRYTLTPAPKKTDLTLEEQELVNNSKSLSEVNKPKTIEEILAMDLSCLGNNSDSDWDDSTTIANDTDDWGDL